MLAIVRRRSAFVCLLSAFICLQGTLYFCFSVLNWVPASSDGSDFDDSSSKLMRFFQSNGKQEAAKLSLREIFQQCRPTMQPPKRRDFVKFPVRIGGAETSKIEEIDCSIPCYHYPFKLTAATTSEQQMNGSATILPTSYDASLVEWLGSVDGEDLGGDIPRPQIDGSMGLSVLRTMESAIYYPGTRLERARKHFDIVMTTRLDSDVPVPYFSWVLHDFMKPPRPKKKSPLGSAFISNCNAKNFRLEAAILLERQFPAIGDFFGSCFGEKRATSNNKTKEELMGEYKFHFAFENSDDLDYVTEKYFQSLVEGTVPVVIGAPNIGDFEPDNGTILSISSLSDVKAVVEKLRQLDTDDDAYSKMLAWKEHGPSNKFKALIDLAIVHSSCRLCIHVADRIRRQERNSPSGDVYGKPVDESCMCKSDNPSNLSAPSYIYRFFVRERGQFEFLEAFIDDKQADSLSSVVEAVLQTFKSSSPDGYWPLWTRERDETGHRPLLSAYYQNGPPALQLYRMYEINASQRHVLYGNAGIDSDEKVANLFRRRQCIYLEVIFV